MKKIKFIPISLEVEERTAPPLPAKTFVPEWYKRGELWMSENGQKVAKSDDKDKRPGMKSCIPFLDAMISGYMLTTWHDLEITRNDGEVEFRYVKVVDGEIIPLDDNEIIPMINERKAIIGYTIPRPAGHSSNHMVWSGKWGIRVPRGWSVMMTHPFNRYELPFTTMSGFMDSDGFWAEGNIPFFIKEGWTGIIPKGTPIAQIIPIQRKSWLGIVSRFSLKYAQKTAHKASLESPGYYKRKIWVKKNYD